MAKIVSGSLTTAVDGVTQRVDHTIIVEDDHITIVFLEDVTYTVGSRLNIWLKEALDGRDGD